MNDAMVIGSNKGSKGKVTLIFNLNVMYQCVRVSLCRSR